MDERVLENYRGDERRRRWPGPWLGDERRADPLAGFVETDQEPDQSPLGLTAQPPLGGGMTPPAG